MVSFFTRVHMRLWERCCSFCLIRWLHRLLYHRTSLLLTSYRNGPPWGVFTLSGFLSFIRHCSNRYNIDITVVFRTLQMGEHGTNGPMVNTLVIDIMPAKSVLWWWWWWWWFPCISRSISKYGRYRNSNMGTKKNNHTDPFPLFRKWFQMVFSMNVFINTKKTLAK